MNEHILAILLVNEAVPFSVIKPLYCSLCQNSDLLSEITRIETCIGRYPFTGTIPKCESVMLSTDSVSGDPPTRDVSPGIEP
jgi:hypothetical protein